MNAPFPYFGGKSRIASEVWQHLGAVQNYVEPFCGSCAMLLSNPHPATIETVNDADCYVSNFWRAVRSDPEAVARHADYPVSEIDLHARGDWIFYGSSSAEFRERMRSDPDFFDAKFAGWWVWGLCCWIGGDWGHRDNGKGINRRLPHLGDNGKGINRQCGSKSRFDFIAIGCWSCPIGCGTCGLRVAIGGACSVHHQQRNSV